MKVLITGINGFVGSILRQSLEKKGHQVFGVDIKSHDSNVFPVDITDQTAVNRCMLEISPDAIYHLAAISQVDYSELSKLYNININGTINLLSASLSLSHLPRFLLVSSCQVYGIVDEANQPINEKNEVKPVNHYGASKAAAEYIAQVFHKIHGLPLAILRPFNHIGRGQDPHFVIAKIIETIKEKKDTIELGNLSVVREFNDVRDVVEIYIKLMEQFPNGMTLNIASGKGYRLHDIIKLIHDLTDITLKIKNTETLIRKNEITTLIGDSTALKNLYNWQPAYSIKETLQWILTE